MAEPPKDDDRAPIPADYISQFALSINSNSAILTLGKLRYTQESVLTGQPKLVWDKSIYMIPGVAVDLHRVLGVLLAKNGLLGEQAKAFADAQDAGQQPLSQGDSTSAIKPKVN